MAAKTESRRPRQEATPDFYARVLARALEHPIIDKRGHMGFEVEAALGSHPISRAGLPCEGRQRVVLTLRQLGALVSRQRRLF